jgi:polyhydroxybutyrate depolymerase
MSGKNMAAMTDLGRQGPAAGVSVVFPDGVDQVWDGARLLQDRPEVDDSSFIQAVVATMRSRGVTEERGLFLVGMSNGAHFAEYVARNAVLDLDGLVLVAGTTSSATRAATPQPRLPVALLCFEGTADPVIPYGGGATGGRGLIGWVSTRRAKRLGLPPQTRVAIGVLDLLEDWRAVNGLVDESADDTLGEDRAGIRTVRRTWESPTGPPITLYEVGGGGHTWPGGPLFLPRCLIGRTSQSLDATALIVAWASRIARSKDASL